MSAERDLHDILEVRLREVPPLRPTLLGDVFDQTRTMPQRRHRWPLHLLRGRTEGHKDASAADAVPAPIPATNGQQPVRGSTMFSALKFVAAGVIVALFGGFLLAGILATPQDGEVLPAAVTASPSPMTTEELLSGMVTEEVQPGVYRVVNDGVRDLEVVEGVAGAIDGLSDYDVVAGLDGGVWVFRPDWFFRVGEEESERAAPPWLSFERADIEVGPDGHVWMAVERRDGTMDLVTFADDPEAALRWGDPTDPTFMDTGERQYLGVEIGSDGTVYTAWLDAPRFVPDYGQIYVETYSDRTWLPLATLRPGGNVFVSDFDVDGSGSGLWLTDGDALHRRDDFGGDWSIIEAPFGPEYLDVGPDGTVWIQTTEPPNRDLCGLRLARFDGTEWETWDDDAGVPDVGPVFFFGGCNGGVRTVAPDGSLWLAASDFLVGRECGGIANFDGVTWTHYLDGLCVYDAAVASDGAVWLQAGEVGYVEQEAVIDDRDPSVPVPLSGLPEPTLEFGPTGLYVITPEAVAAVE